MPFGKWRSGAYVNPDAEQEFAGPDYPDEDNEDVTNYLSDILATMERIDTSINELVNQGDKQVEFLSRLVTLFESAAREARNARD